MFQPAVTQTVQPRQQEYVNPYGPDAEDDWESLYQKPHRKKRHLMKRLMQKFNQYPVAAAQPQYDQPQYVEPKPKRDWTPVKEELQKIGEAAAAFVGGALLAHYLGKK